MRKIALIWGLVLLFVSVSQAETPIYSDDFSVDPAAGWSGTNDFGEGAITWNSADDLVELAVTTDNEWGGYASYWTTDNTDAGVDAYFVDVDFQLTEDQPGVAGSNILDQGGSIGVYVQRQLDNSRYRIRGYIGGDGSVEWRSDGGGLTDVSDGFYEGELVLNQWYTFHVAVLDTGSQIEIKAVIYEQGTNTIAVPWSAMAVDSSAGRYSSCNGYGFQAGIGCTGVHGNTRAGEYMDIDNFVVSPVTGGTTECVAFNDDFSAAPGGNWYGSNDFGSGSITWNAGNTNVDMAVSADDPSGGFASYWTSGVSAACDAYSIEVDFILKDNDLDRKSYSIGVYAQRQFNDSSYRIRAYVGGDGSVDWRSNGGGLSEVSDGFYEGMLNLDQWYTLHVDVLDTGTQIEIKAVVYEQGTSNVAVPWSAVAVDSSPDRYIGSSGYGFQAGTGNTVADTYVTLDNFSVTPGQSGQADCSSYEDDFAADPGTDWLSINDDGNGSLDWNAANENIEHSVYEDSFTGGYASYWTTGIHSACADQGYSIDLDFMLHENDAERNTHSIGVYAQRQFSDSAYRIRAFVGVNGDVEWRSNGGGLTDVADGLYEGMLNLNQWYTLHAVVLDVGSHIEIQAVIFEQGTTTVAAPWSAVAVDTSAGRYTTCTGFGFQAGTTNSVAGTYATLDNFVVTQNSGDAYLDGDICGLGGGRDHYVDFHDLACFTQSWLKCSASEVSRCEVAGDDGDPMTIVPAVSITVDGDLSDWVDAVWIPLEELYYGDATHDIVEAKYAARWVGNTSDNLNDPNDAGMIYVAVIVNDSDHWFSNSYTMWNWSDRIEVYIQGQGGLGGSYSSNQDIAQQYIVGLKENETSAWATLGGDRAVPENAGLVYAAGVDGALLKYELAIRVYDYFGELAGQPSTVIDLVSGQLIGFDVVANTVFGDSAEGFSMVSENTQVGKSANAASFAVRTLTAGTFRADINEDQYVNLKDFAILANDWLECSDAANPECL